MHMIDDTLATQMAALLNAPVTPADATKMVAVAGPALALIARQHLPFDSEPSHLARNLALAAAAKAGAK